jgi:hypothetical protein
MRIEGSDAFVNPESAIYNRRARSIPLAVLFAFAFLLLPFQVVRSCRVD